MPFEIGPVLRFESRLVAGRRGGYVLRVVTGIVLGFLLGVYFLGLSVQPQSRGVT